MPWKETSKGCFERPFDSLERFYRAIKDGGKALNREHFAISAVVKLRLNPCLDDTAAALQHAWKTMRYDYPQIAAFESHENTYRYEIPDSNALDSWLSSTFKIEPSTATTADIYADYAPTELAKMHYFPHTSEVLFHSSHWRIDGIGVLYLLDGFFKAVASPRSVRFGDEGKNLSLGLDEAAQVPTNITAKSEKAATDLVATFLDNVPSIGLPTGFNTVPGRSRRCEIDLPEALTSAIVSRCKLHGLSVTSATHAAVVCVTVKIGDKEIPAQKYTSWAAFDLRRHCPPPYNGSKYPVSIFHTGIPTTIIPSGFMENALQFEKTYKRCFTGSASQNVFPFLSWYVGKVRSILTQDPPQGITPPCEPNLSSLGRIDEYMDTKFSDTVDVMDFWIGVEMLTRQLMVYVWTRGNKMKLSICYNESFYGSDFVERFLESTKREIVEGLGI
ncbi:hypothetical protein BDR22DRAFT_865479 [Usnea florida]